VNPKPVKTMSTFFCEAGCFQVDILLKSLWQTPGLSATVCFQFTGERV
jgi:hypothetical protein